MPTILLLTAAVMPDDHGETALVAAELADLGVSSRIVPWTDDELSDLPADLIMIRTTWDYTTRLPEFLAVLGSLSAPMRNGLAVVRWNCHKGYLAQLGRTGVPVVPTTMYLKDDGGDGMDPPIIDASSAEIVIKPAVSAGARGIGRFRTGAPEAVDHLLEVLKSGDALVQAFQPDVAAGERSLIFLGGRLSHAVLKTPAAGDFRVQVRHGGVNSLHDVTAAEMEVAQTALAEVPGGADELLYARVDLVGDPNSPLVMELELIEPELFLPMSAGSARALAEAAVARL